MNKNLLKIICDKGNIRDIKLENQDMEGMVSAVCLADVDIACGELKNAGTRLEYAIREGGTLYVVEDARRMLAELEQKERVKGTSERNE